VADYVKYRPDYPRQVVALLAEAIGMSPAWVVADIGCGTGISCRMFLGNGNQVIGVEPNDDMRAAAVPQFAGREQFAAVKGTAEATNLQDKSVDLVIAAQAFHWFDGPTCAVEWKRILRSSPGGYVALMWNHRLNTTGFGKQYDQLLHSFGTDYRETAHRTPVDLVELQRVFGVPFARIGAPNHQDLDFDSLCGRVRSSSYVPLRGQAGHDELFAGLRELFDRHQRGGLVRFDYETELFFGKLR